MKKILRASVILFCCSASALASSPSSVKSTAITANEIKNARCCIPSLGNSDDDLVTFKNGSVHSQAYPFAELRAMAFGTLDGKPAAVAEMCWNTGGSGNWETILLFRRINGRVEAQGAYDAEPDLPGGATMVCRIEIKNNKVLMYGEDPVHSRKVTKPLVRSSSCFKPCKYGKKT